jgi:formylglycine-generating enzyme required for sulfatase activity
MLMPNGSALRLAPERDLPTEDEWIVAAAGDKDKKFPWGSDDASGVNTNADHDPKRLTQKDGWKGRSMATTCGPR